MTSRPDILASPTPTGGPWGGSWHQVPRIVAESLVAVSDPLRTGLTAGPAASGADVARALACSLAPAQSAAPSPPWLLPGQVPSFRRTLAAIERYNVALLADPVGSGKTYVALAVAAAIQHRRLTACLVPAPLTAQWRRVAEQLGVPVEVGTHQRASRGALPGGTAGLVIIDESHHFRNPLTCRYAYAAPWMLGRPVLLLSATPVVNRLDDLSHQLLLGMRDDALLAEGVVSLRTALATGTGTSALGQVVVESTGSAGPRPSRSAGMSAGSDEENAQAVQALDRLARLELSQHPPTAALVRSVLQRAIASSPAALAGALRRYRTLLLNARDAWQAGRALSRAELREFAGEMDDQLVMWELFAQTAGQVELVLEDLAALDGLVTEAGVAAASVDLKAERLRAILSDGRPTLVFAARRETVRHLRDLLAPPPIAWCTGERAGLGRSPVPRAVVLGWFRETQPNEPVTIPRCLVVTDVAAEGLDLRRAERVVHYDLPWTPTRLEQREGRAVRLGSAHERIQVVRFALPLALEAALGMSARLARKAALPARAGLGADGLRLWRWRSALAEQLTEAQPPDAPAARGTAVVRGAAAPGLLAGFELHTSSVRHAEPLAAAVGWLSCDGRWTEEETVVAARLLEASRAQEVSPAAPNAVRVALDRLTRPIRERLVLAGARRWGAAEPDPCARRLAARLSQMIREAARRRDQSELVRLERALAFAAGGHTAGEARLVRRLADADPRELGRWAVRVPAPSARRDVIEVRLTGLVLFER